MMGKHASGKGIFNKGLAVLVVALGLNACAMAEKPKDPTGKDPKQVVKEIKLLIAEDGSITVKGGAGATVDRECSLDPDAKDACPIYEKGKRIQVERIEPVILMKYQVNPGCYLVGAYSYARLICYP